MRRKTGKMVVVKHWPMARDSQNPFTEYYYETQQRGNGEPQRSVRWGLSFVECRTIQLHRQHC